MTTASVLLKLNELKLKFAVSMSVSYTHIGLWAKVDCECDECCFFRVKGSISVSSDAINDGGNSWHPWDLKFLLPISWSR